MFCNFNERIFLEKPRGGEKKKKPSEKLLFETFCLTNVKSKSIEVLKYFSGLLWC